MTRIDELKDILELQRGGVWKNPKPSAEWRIERIDRCVDLLVENESAICQALSRDFGTRGSVASRFADMVPAIRHAKYVRRNIKKWMRPEVRRPDFPYNVFGGKARIEQQPLGVVGVIVPWNGPIGMALVGAIDALSAGNRVMIKLSENAPISSSLLEEIAPKYFDRSEVAFITGGSDIAVAFAELPLDHLLFTGGTGIGSNVMSAAARNLVPVTLELGGKCPAIVGPDAEAADAADKIIMARLLNGGQACITPDYALVPKAKIDAFIDAASATVKQAFPSIVGNDDYTSIINDRHYQRIVGYVEEAKAAGCRVVEMSPPGEMLPDTARRLIAPTLIIDPPTTLRVCDEEIFGPVMLVFPYDSIDSAIRFVSNRPKPLAVYYFGRNETDIRNVLDRTSSGGVAINDLLLQLLMSELPFGGVGASGSGRYWGGDSGFKRFSNPRSIYVQGWLPAAVGNLFRPPFGKTIEMVLSREIRKTRTVPRASN